MNNSMKNIFFIFLFFYSFSFAQQDVEWIDKLKNPEFKSYQFKDENIKDSFLKYDFSTLLVTRRKFLGYIEPNYRRIEINFSSILKDDNNPARYDVEGVSVVKNNKCDFKVYIQIDKIWEYENMHFGLDNVYKDVGLKAQGVMIGKYLFEEDSRQPHSGRFQGIMTLFWYIDRFDILHYDNIEYYSDGYSNNQYVGTWNSYTNNNSKICNWGENRIPFSGDLDIGTAEFHPNEKYYDQGWAEWTY